MLAFEETPFFNLLVEFDLIFCVVLPNFDLVFFMAAIPILIINQEFLFIYHPFSKFLLAASH
jgi:hypothetical protein